MARFVTVAKADSIQPGQMVKVEIDNLPVAVANVGGTFHAFDDTCTHEDCSLAEGELARTTVTCPCHFAEFDIRTGAVLAPPATVPLKGGERLEFDSVLIATGGRNRRFPIPGLDLPGVYDLRTVADADRIRDAIARGGRAVVVGMGFIGAEVAASMRQCGLEVTAIEPFKTPLYRALGEDIGQVVEALHRDHGVAMILGDAVAAFEGKGRVERVVTRDGRRIECDLAVFGLGIEPATELVAGTGVRIDNGIVVDEYCRTNAPGIFAAVTVATHH